VSRDRDVRNAIQAALLATSQFDAVWIWGLPENYGAAASNLAAAAIEPVGTEETDRWDSEPDGALEFASTVRLTLLYRNDDPQLRDEGAELLLDTATNALNGQSLAGLTLPPWTIITAWSWAEPVPPERRITATFRYRYLVEGWAALDTTP
jgi:hypothetical protein